MCATHGKAWAAEAHGDLATNNLHTHAHTQTHTYSTRVLVQTLLLQGDWSFTLSSTLVLFPRYILGCMRLGGGNEGVSVCESILEHPECSETRFQQIVEQLELPIDAKKRQTQSLHTNELLFFTETGMSSLSAPHPSFLWLPDSWQGQIYSSESSARWLRVLLEPMSWPQVRVLRLLFSSVGFPPFLWHWWNPEDACSQMSQRQRQTEEEGGRLHWACNILRIFPLKCYLSM